MIWALLLSACTTPPPVVERLAEPCDPQRQVPGVSRQVELRVLRDRSVPAARAAQQVDEAVRTWAAAGVAIRVVEPEVVDLPAILVGSDAAVEAALRAREVDPVGPMDAVDREVVRQVVGEVVLGPLRTYLQAHAVPARTGVDAVILPRIAAPGSPGDQAFERIDGVTLRADLVDRGDATADLVRLLGIDRFTPTAFVGLAGVDARAPDGWEGTLAHELGHALGLDHVTDPNNLMAVEPPRCRPYLEPEQLEQLQISR